MYTSLWAVYLVSIGFAFLLLWNLTRWSGKWIYLARFIRLLFLAVMLVPATLSTNADFLSPAIVVAPFDFLQGYDEGSLSALVNLLAALTGAVGIFVIYLVITLIVHSRKKA